MSVNAGTNARAPHLPWTPGGGATDDSSQTTAVYLLRLRAQLRRATEGSNRTDGQGRSFAEQLLGYNKLGALLSQSHAGNRFQRSIYAVKTVRSRHLIAKF